jgi:hypothetical protein
VLVAQKRVIMGILNFIFGDDKKKADLQDKTFDHQILGEMYMDTDSSWFVEEVSLPIAKNPISVSLEGKETAPNKEALDGFEELMQNWNTIKKNSGIEAELYELYENYFSEEEPSIKLDNPADIWESAKLLSIFITSIEDFSTTWIFTWQDPKDDHEITVYVEEGNSAGSSVDG